MLAYRRFAFAPNTFRFDRLNDSVVQGTDEWLALRHGSVGSSEAGAVFPTGVSTTVKHPELVGKIKGAPPTVHDDFVLGLFEQGKKMEPFLRAEMEQILKEPVVETGIMHMDAPIAGYVPLSASLDGVAFRFCPGEAVLCEFKWRCAVPGAGWNNTSERNYDHLGATVYCQVQHQMLVSGVKMAYVYVGSECSPLCPQARRNSRGRYITKYRICDECGGQRNMWQVLPSNDYLLMWMSYYKTTIDMARGTGTRYGRGLATQCKNNILRFMRSSVRRIALKT